MDEDTLLLVEGIFAQPLLNSIFKSEDKED
jgi:hypothetical protein